MSLDQSQLEKIADAALTDIKKDEVKAQDDDNRAWGEVPTNNIGKLMLGNLMWIPVPYDETNLQIVESEWVPDNAGGKKSKTAYAPANLKKHFKERSNTLGAKLDLNKNSLENSEEIFLGKAKLRPCVVLGISDTKISTNPAFSPTFLLAPLYSCYPKATSFDSIATLKAKCFYHPEFFYVEGTPGTPISKESIIRLDKTFWSQLKFPIEVRTHYLRFGQVVIARNKLLELYKIEDPKKPNAYEEIKDRYLAKLPSEFKT